MPDRARCAWENRSSTAAACPIDPFKRAFFIWKRQPSCVECGTSCHRADADIHHLLPRSAGGSDEPSNLVTLCDGCHAAHHPSLAAGLARRAIERWAARLALWLDREGAISEQSQNFGPALRLFGLARFRDGQLPVVQAALTGRSLLVVSPTGFGKTLCFQLPATLRRGVSVVVSPYGRASRLVDEAQDPGELYQ